MTFDRTSAVAVAHVLAVAVEFLLEWSLHVQFIVIVSARVQVRVSQKRVVAPFVDSFHR